MTTNEETKGGLGRREALGIIAGGVAVTAAAVVGATVSGTSEAAGPASKPAPEAGPRAKVDPPKRMPVAFVPHGGGPWPYADLGVPKHEYDALASYLEGVRAYPASAPKALLVVSAHWEERVPTVMTSARPPMLYDYYGFPPESYEVKWSAPGAPELAERVRALLGAAGFETATDPARGFDHGTFVPLGLPYPKADVPTMQLSLEVGLDPARHLAMGRALAPLRDEGVFIIGSGMTYHNLRAFRASVGSAVSEAFDAWLRETVVAPAAERDRRLAAWSRAPSARQAHPREEHLLPLMVIAGAAGDDAGVVDYNGTYYGLRLSGYHFG